MRLLLILSLLTFMLPSEAKSKTVTLRFIETSDVHGSFFPVNYLTGKESKGSLARVSTYVKNQRKLYGNNVILLENGDILQGQPTNYFWNFINTEEENIAASIINYMNYDAQCFGNHDVETGHKVYDKWVSELNCPVLGANIINKSTGKPYTKPYVILNREGVKIAILGMLTAAIPNWLSEDIWEGMAFEEMIASSRKWMEVLKREEKPDVIIGLFHSGKSGGIVTTDYEENVSERLAKEVPGFDVIFYGHDHMKAAYVVPSDKLSDGISAATQKSAYGSNPGTWLIDPANGARSIGQATIALTVKNGKVAGKDIKGELVDIENEEVDTDFMAHFKNDIEKLTEFCNKRVGELECDVNSSDLFFGSSALGDLILNLQLQITGADISFNAPLLYNSTLKKGPLTMADMFSLYKYENKLYVMKMTGKEIKGHLEMSYALWTNQMKSPEDHIMRLSPSNVSNEREGFLNPFFNFDSAAGIDYEVDVTKPEGEKVRILRMSNGDPFDEDKWYKVAVNSYRGNGGGELITKGAGIPKEEIDNRIIYRSELDQRYYLMKEIERMGHITPKPNNNWRFVPDEWAKPAIERDRMQMFGR